MARVEKAARGAATPGRAKAVGPLKKTMPKPSPVTVAKVTNSVTTTTAGLKRAKPVTPAAAAGKPPTASAVPKAVTKPAPKPAAKVASKAAPGAPPAAAKPPVKTAATATPVSVGKTTPRKLPAKVPARRDPHTRGEPLDKFLVEQQQLLLEERSTHVRHAYALKV